jgi:hypothetical protein
MTDKWQKTVIEVPFWGWAVRGRHFYRFASANARFKRLSDRPGWRIWRPAIWSEYHKLPDMPERTFETTRD